MPQIVQYNCLYGGIQDANMYLYNKIELAKSKFDYCLLGNNFSLKVHQCVCVCVCDVDEQNIQLYMRFVLVDIRERCILLFV